MGSVKRPGGSAAAKSHVARRVTCVLVLALGVLLSLGSVAASGALFYPFDGQLAPSSGSFELLKSNSVAIDDLNGNTYVADSGIGVVDVFSSTGEQLASLDAGATPAGSFGGGEVAVAANNGTGDVYVLDSTDNVVDEFDASGAYLCQITGSSTPSASECNGVAGSDTPAHGLSTPRGIAIDQATGEVYVGDPENGVIDVFSPGGEYERQIVLSAIEEFNPDTSGLAVDDANEQVYLADEGLDVVYQFDKSGNLVATLNGENTPAGSFGGGFVSVAADDASGNFYVAANTNTEPVVDVFSPSGESIGQIRHPFNVPRGVVVDQASGKVYVSENEPTAVSIFGPVVLIPDVTTGSAQGITPTSAELEGTVNPDEVELTSCEFEYGTDTSYGQTAPCVPGAGEIPADPNPHTVTAVLSGLQAGQTYHFRLVAGNANGASFGEDAEFSTPPPPTIEQAAASELTGSTAKLSAQINPNGFDTTYRFEWGTSTAYGTTVPVPDGDIGSGSSLMAVGTVLSGLGTNTTYHWRVVAVNANGTTLGPDHTFVYETTGTAGLPDGRAYEMVTPPAKNAALIGDVFHGLNPDVAESGQRLILSSIQCFADATSCTGARGEVGSPFSFTRGSGGWTTTPLAPPAPEFGAPTALRFSAQAGTALFSSSTLPTGEDHFYARGVDGFFRDIGPATPPELGPLGPNSYAATPLVATADVSHVVYVDEQPIWPFDGGSAQSVYQYSGFGNAAPALVGVSGGTGSADLISACGTYLGGSGEIPVDLDGSLSADGRTVYFTAKACSEGSGANAGTPVPADALYARIDSAQTALVSQRSPGDCTLPACQGSPPGDALFEGASADGSKVVFTSVQQLTDQASEDGEPGDSAGENECHETVGPNGCNLYLYDFDNPAAHRLIDVSAGDVSGHGPRVQGSMAISADGSHVYFVARGVLGSLTNAQGQAPKDGSENLYVFDRASGQKSGQLHFIARLPEADSGDWALGPEQANVTPDGRFLVFVSRGALTSDDARPEGPTQVYRYDAQSGQLLRISIGENGFNDNGNAGLGDASIVPAANLYAHAGPVRPDPSMSHDGSYVFFQSSVALTPHALDEAPVDAAGVSAQNIYEWHDGHVSLISDGRDAQPVSLNGETDQSAVHLLGSDATGANVFFSTADQLVPKDTDTEIDYYDARVCTASEPCVAPPPQPAPPCGGATCHEPPGKTSPPTPSPGTLGFIGKGNLVPRAPGGSPIVRKARLLGSSVRGARLVLRLALPAKGRVTIRGGSIRRLQRSTPAAGTRKLTVVLTARARTAIHAGRRVKIKLLVEFRVASGAVSTASFLVTVGRGR